ncbi:MAG: universal stress protein, partial [Acidimicrobiia bacterium]
MTSTRRADPPQQQDPGGVREHGGVNTRTTPAPTPGGTAGSRRGTLRIYLGAAPGVGKTYAMLNEGWRRKERGTDVVIGFVETYGRAQTIVQIRDAEVVPRTRMEYRDAVFEEMDVDAILRRRPEVALVDELAHTNVPGSRNEKRWQDVEELLDAGITVISTVNIQHLESLNDVVERITGIRQRETVPDEVVRQAEQVELVDMTPEALRRRLAHGNVYAPEKIDAALANYFRPGNLGALRELALLWVADQVDVALEHYRDRHGITEPWETRERVIVAVTGAPGTESLVRRAARIARRAHGELIGVHVTTDEGLVGPPGGLLDQHRRLLEEMGGQYHETVGADVAAALVDFARSENATQLVLGASRLSRWAELTRGSVINRAVRLSGPIDVH